MSSTSRPLPFLGPIFAMVALAFVLTGCGIKSALEPPQAARLAEPAGSDAAATSPAKETSRVEAGRGYDLLPPSSPLEWEKDKPKKNNSAASKAGSKSTAPEKPFILDGLL